MTPLARTSTCHAVHAACAALLVGTSMPALADEAPARTDGVRPWVVESCVSADRLVLSASDPWVLLDAAERASTFEQMQARYPVLQNDGVVPSQIALWHRPGGAWVYVTLLAHPARPEQLCFTATVVARALAITTALLQKYFALRSAEAGLSAPRRPAARS